MTDDDGEHKPIQVTIFGAGVTGLTVAHELIVRGFGVNVVEKRSRLEGWPYCVVGGMAATQYAYEPEADSGEGKEFSTRLRGPSIDLSGRLVFKEGCVKCLEEPNDLRSLYQRIHAFEGEKLTITIHAYAGFGQIKRASDRAEQIRTWLKDGLEQLPTPSDGSEAMPPDELDYEEFAMTGDVDGDGLASESTVSAASETAEKVVYKIACHTQTVQTIDEPRYWRRVELHYQERRYPGEHGYRYFPGYYRHLFDTMKRTPVYDEKGLETHETVYDNLIPTDRTAFAAHDHAILSLTRRRPRSLEEMRKQLEMLLEGLHFSWQDIVRLQLKLLRYLSSSGKRRQCYEKVSWWDFVEGEKFSPQAQEFMLNTPQALLAMSAKHSDARAQGNTLVQLLLDQLAAEPRTDKTLNGPTSEAWLGHWRRFLEYQGVKFHLGELELFAESEDRVIPIVRAPDSTVLELPSAKPKSIVELYVETDFFVLATDVAGAQRAARHLDAKCGSAVRMLLDYPLNRNDQLPKLDEPLRFFSGIQFYFRRRLDMFKGHIFFNKTQWGLSSISQPQFWRRRRVAGTDRYLTVVSVIIGRFDVKGSNGKTAWECTRDELARETWAQVKEALGQTARLADPEFYHIDQNLIFNRMDRFTFRVTLKDKGRGDRVSNVGTVTLADGFADAEPSTSSPTLTRWTTSNVPVDIPMPSSEQEPVPAPAVEGVEPKKALPLPGIVVFPSNGVLCPIPQGFRYEPGFDFVGRDCFTALWQERLITFSVETRKRDAPVVRDATETISGVGRDIDFKPFICHPCPGDKRFELQIVSFPTRGVLEGVGGKKLVLEYTTTMLDPGKDRNRIGRNLTPFHTHPVGDWKRRPGKLPSHPTDRHTHHARAPQLEQHEHNLYKNLVLAGTYMKTFTRLTTMEAANESARHAVNTILTELELKNHGTQVAEPCEIWDPEQHEIDDFANLKLLDEALFDAGLPHFIDILQLDRWPDALIDWKHDDLSLRPYFEQLGRLLRRDPTMPSSSLGDILGKLGASSLPGPLDLLEKLREHEPGLGAAAALFEQLTTWLGKLGDQASSP